MASFVGGCSESGRNAPGRHRKPVQEKKENPEILFRQEGYVSRNTHVNEFLLFFPEENTGCPWLRLRAPGSAGRAKVAENSFRLSGIAAVAELAGVSTGTVSKALNGTGQLRESTRLRVWAAAEQVGWLPNGAARSMRSGRTFTVGVITTDSYGRFSIPVLRGVEDALGLGEMLCFLCDSRDDPLREQHYLRTLLARQVDGIIAVGRKEDPRVPLGKDLPVPVIYAFAPSTDPADCSIVGDEQDGARRAVDHLVKTGRRRIAHITGPENHASAVLRSDGFRTAMAAQGLDPVDDVWFGSWSEEWGHNGVRALLSASPDVDAIFCGSDQIARGAAYELAALGRSIPEDVALIGVDNWSPFTDGYRPRLSSVDLNLGTIGRRAGEALLAALEGTLSPGIHKVQPELVIRESSGPGSRPA
ncbi:LacI family DNA-binding transcriptional regulator [Sinomonas albida]|uniref:LacI family DNA-binding transcriptional regulator n=1 Tax=Sinomonas albida TaxID=369942 RepID=UPI0030179948